MFGLPATKPETSPWFSGPPSVIIFESDLMPCLLIDSFNTKTSFPERASQPMIIEMSFLFQFDKVLLGIVDLRSKDKEPRW